MKITDNLKTFFGNKQEKQRLALSQKYWNCITTVPQQHLIGVSSGWYNGLDLMLITLNVICVIHPIFYMHIHEYLLYSFVLLSPYDLHTVWWCATLHYNTYWNCLWSYLYCTLIEFQTDQLYIWHWVVELIICSDHLSSMA